MAENMKKISLIVALALLAVLVLGSCNREVCPAYGSAATEIPESIG